ncbi:MAG: hypothetical protein QME55_00475 [Brevundimonas sp.]|uniref:hypothetical protein n=1 Tax=Brevundimonas sp. TaxID=1871086 RepID=UPI00263A33B2|nr:hypothetical protein [Brevundimonas sp.]MDI6623177.1 hypothetical protein [Brevundimonas sp.]MDQ7811208.1 hypothetical protein [Brevundimonas sp.]
MTRRAQPDTDANGVRSDVPAATDALATAKDQLASLRQRHQQAEADHDAAEAALKAAGVQMAGDLPGAAEAYETASAALTRSKALLDGFNATVIPDAEAAVVAAEERLLEATRAYAADVAEAECLAAAARLETEYPELVARFEDLKATVAAADHKRMLANKALPTGRNEMAPIEHRVRDILASPGGVVAEEIVSVWCYAGTLRPVAEDRIDQIIVTGRDRDTGQSHHILPSRSARGGVGNKVELRRLKKLTIGERTQAVRSARLSDLVLPPLRPEGEKPRLRTELVEIDSCADA